MKTLLLIPALSLLACDPPLHNTVPPEKAAAEFMDSMGIKFQGKPSCTGVDTDGDGYVTCTVALSGGDVPRMLSIQCAALVDSNGYYARYTTGCKETQQKVQPVQVQAQ